MTHTKTSAACGVLSCRKNIFAKATLIGLLCLISAAVVPTAAQGEPVPQNIASLLQQREETLSSSTFRWQLTDEETYQPLFPPAKIAALRIEGEKGWERYLRKGGATNEAEIKKSAASNAEQQLTALQGGHLKYSNEWRFEREKTETLVTGTTQSLTGLTSTQQQFYEGDLALVASISMHTANGRTMSITDPGVWKTAGDSLRYPSPMLLSLGLTPEHHAMLLGLNPLTLHGANWQLLSTTPGAWVIAARVTEGAFPATIQVTLDRTHAGAVSDITIKKARQSQHFHAEGFHLVDGNWLPQTVHFTSEVAQMFSIRQEWTLKSVAPSRPIQVNLTQPNPVHDYRLLGTNLSQRTILNAEMGSHRGVVYYQWPGHFPTDQELTQKHPQ